jgi:hypothetical protein
VINEEILQSIREGFSQSQIQEASGGSSAKLAGLEKCSSQYGNGSVIPCPSNQKKGVEGVLRVDKKFRSREPQELRRVYRKRVVMERVFSRLKNLADLKEHNLRGWSK